MKPFDPHAEPCAPVGSGTGGRVVRHILEGLAILVVSAALVMTPSVSGLGKAGNVLVKRSSLDAIAANEVDAQTQRRELRP
jgi:hypothetical protein